ncbi:MAG: imidazole glycerol phosphate synthase subunit HisH [Bacilli bacterium]
MITVVDYGMGNLFSVCNTLSRLNVPYTVSSDIDIVGNSEALLLPGVGSFAEGMKHLRSSGLKEAIDTAVLRDVPVLGICLGMQLLLESSTEEEYSTGLGYIPGNVQHFRSFEQMPKMLKIPHMGWNKLHFTDNKTTFAQQHVYFVHSYVAKVEPQYIIAHADYGITVPAVIRKENITGMQFHPEKSGTLGMQLLTTWLTANNLIQGVKL